MKKFNPETIKVATETALATIQPQQHEPLDRFGAYIGLDVHKDTVMVAIALPGRAQATIECEIANKEKTIAKLVTRLSRRFAGQLLLFCYEAGPCGYGIQRQIMASGHDGDVIAPSKIPRKSGEKVKTDRIDARKLARYLRSGELTPVWIPGHEQEDIRDLTRARSDMKSQEHKARQQLNAFVLRHGHGWPSGKTRWTKSHFMMKTTSCNHICLAQDIAPFFFSLLNQKKIL